MHTRLNPYLSFRDNARAAMEFYNSVFGGKLEMMTFGDGQASSDPAAQNNIMHAELNTPGGLVLMGADTPPGMGPPGGNGSISLSGDNDAELSGYWTRLSEGGTVTVPLEPAPWGDIFGKCTDKFGINWLVNISAART